MAPTVCSEINIGQTIIVNIASGNTAAIIVI